jgi:hypothetical protein
MRRGLLQDFANTACQMFVGWRIWNDLPRLLAVGEGVVEIDLLTAETLLAGRPVEPLSIGHEIRSWLRERIEAEGVPAGLVTSARLTVAFAVADRPGRSPGHVQRRLLFRCESAVVAAGRTYASVLVDEQLGVKEGGGPWVVR